MRRPDPSGTDVAILLLVGLALVLFIVNGILHEAPRGGTITRVEEGP